MQINDSYKMRHFVKIKLQALNSYSRNLRLLDIICDRTHK